MRFLPALWVALIAGAVDARGSTPEPLCPDCNVILVSLDALQAAHMHSLGYARRLTPTIDAMAGRGYLFTQAFSPAPWTVPASMSWFTGVYPSRHKVVNKFVPMPDGRRALADLRQLSPGLVTLTETLKAGGYATGGFTGDAGVNGAFGFDQGFDVYTDSVPPFSGMGQSIDKALTWLSGLAGGKFFLFLHGYDVHGQCMPAGGYDRRFVDPGYDRRYNGTPEEQRDLRERGLREGRLDLRGEDIAFWRAVYDEKAARMDAEFARFIGKIESMGLADNTVFVLVSDHGTELAEHGRLDHGFTLYDETIHVPLIIVPPKMRRGKVIRRQVSTLGLMPTILDLVGAPAGAAAAGQMQGRSLAPLLLGKGRSEDVLSETDYRLYTHKRSIRTADGWKLIETLETGRAELYHVRRDPREAVDLAGREELRVDELRRKLALGFQQAGVDIKGQSPSLGCLPVYADQCR